MPISPMNFPILSFEQANPLLAGVKTGSDLVGTYLQNKIQGAQAKYAERDILSQILERELKNQSSTIKNKYLEPREQAQLAYEQQQVPYLQALTQKTGLENQYYGRKTEAEIAHALATAMLNREQAKYYEPNIKSEIDYRKAQADAQRFKAENPMLGEPGVVGAIGAQLFLRKHPELTGQVNSSQQPSLQEAPNVQVPFRNPMQNSAPNGAPIGIGPFSMQTSPNTLEGVNNPQDLIGVLQNALFADLKRKQAGTDYLNTRTQGFEWSALPTPERADYLATTRALGYEPREAIKAYTEGKTISELAAAHGFDPNNLPEKQYPTGSALVNQIQKANTIAVGLDAVEPLLTDAIAPYSARFANGVSPKLIKDLVKGGHENEVGDALGAFALQPELAFARARIAGGQPGVTVMEEMLNAAHGRIKTFGLSPNEKVYRRMQGYIKNKIEMIRKAENKEAFKQRGQVSNENASENSDESDMALLRIAAGEE